MRRGYIALWRKIQDHEFYKERRVFSKFEAWLDILMEAQHEEEPKQVIIGMTCLTCHYGECLKSNVTWAKRWNWTEAKVRRFLKMLEKMSQIRRKNEGITTRLSVINYSVYDPKRRRNDDETTSKRRASDEQATTDNNDNNVNNNNPPLPPQTPKPKSASKKFVPPTEQEVVNYFAQNGYSAQAAKKAFKYYSVNDWKDSRGNPVKNWKQKMIANWFKDQNRQDQQPAPRKAFSADNPKDMEELYRDG